jgi:hypothetical protein
MVGRATIVPRPGSASRAHRPRVGQPMRTSQSLVGCFAQRWRLATRRSRSAQPPSAVQQTLCRRWQVV